MLKPRTADSFRKIQENRKLRELIAAIVKLWRKHHPTDDQAGYIGKEVRR